MKLTDKERSLLVLIGDDGAYGRDIPDNDATTATLTRCVEMCWLIWEPSLRGDDFFYLSPNGIQTLQRT